MIEGLSLMIAAPEGNLALIDSAADRTIRIVSPEKGTVATIDHDAARRVLQFLSLVLSEPAPSLAEKPPLTDWALRMAEIKEAHPKAYTP